MKTPDEIKKGLECCISDTYGCNEKCPYFNSLSNGVDCAVKMHADALAYIQQLETNNHQLLTKVKQLQAERDAAVADIRKTCSTCKHYYFNRQDDDTADCLWFDGCKNEDHWEWCGVKEE